jgi:hypothetical protein
LYLSHNRLGERRFEDLDKGGGMKMKRGQHPALRRFLDDLGRREMDQKTSLPKERISTIEKEEDVVDIFEGGFAVLEDDEESDR